MASVTLIHFVVGGSSCGQSIYTFRSFSVLRLLLDLFLPVRSVLDSDKSRFGARDSSFASLPLNLTEREQLCLRINKRGNHGFSHNLLNEFFAQRPTYSTWPETHRCRISGYTHKWPCRPFLSNGGLLLL